MCLRYLRTLLRDDAAFCIKAAKTDASTPGTPHTLPPRQTRRQEGGGRSRSTATTSTSTVRTEALVPLFSANTSIIYHGISLGGVLGGGYVLSSPYIHRAILNVGGSPFSLILSRFPCLEGARRLLVSACVRRVCLRASASACVPLVGLVTSG